MDPVADLDGAAAEALPPVPVEADDAEHAALADAAHDEVEVLRSLPLVLDSCEAFALSLGCRLLGRRPRHVAREMLETLVNGARALFGVGHAWSIEHEAVAEVDPLGKAHRVRCATRN